MTIQQQLNYKRIAEAISYIQQHFKQQPGLDEIAEQMHLSPFHFQRLFTEWAGISPKKFLQYISVAYAKKLLKEDQATLFDAAYQTGLSGTSRLHDLFVQIEGMTPGDYKNGGKNLTIYYVICIGPFGLMIIASTSKGICHLAFIDDELAAMNSLNALFPKAKLAYYISPVLEQVLSLIMQDWSKPIHIKLHLKGTNFQLKVWETLLKIPTGKLTTYGNIAAQINKPKASRAVGSAIGNNPVGFIIPCHRVIQSTGLLGGYMWGTTRKAALIGWEAAQINQSNLV